MMTMMMMMMMMMMMVVVVVVMTTMTVMLVNIIIIIIIIIIMILLLAYHKHSEKLVSMGYGRKEIEECLSQNVYNEIMATYLLLVRKPAEVSCR